MEEPQKTLVQALHADPRKMEREELLSCCKLWHIEDGSFVQAERRGQFDSNSKVPRPTTRASRRRSSAVPHDGPSVTATPGPGIVTGRF